MRVLPIVGGVDGAIGPMGYPRRWAPEGDSGMIMLGGKRTGNEPSYLVRESLAQKKGGP